MQARRCSLAALLVVATLALGQPATSAQTGTWSVVHLRALDGDVLTNATDVNASGVAVGSSVTNPFDSSPVVWSSNGTPTALPVPSNGLQGEATAINDAGTIVGYSVSAQVIGISAYTALRWTPGANGYQMDVLGGGRPYDINASGVIVGTIPTIPVASPALFRPGQAPAPLPTAGQVGEAERVSDAGVIVGDDSGPAAWFLGTRYPLYPGLSQGFGGIPVEVTDVINAFYTLGNITVGERTLSFIQAPGGAYYPIAPDVYESNALDMNNFGIGAGIASAEGGTPYAAVFVYGTTEAVRSKLAPADQTAWPTMTVASSISDGVHVVGNGTRTGSNVQQSWLARPRV